MVLDDNHACGASAEKYFIVIKVDFLTILLYKHKVSFRLLNRQFLMRNIFGKDFNSFISGFGPCFFDFVLK